MSDKSKVFADINGEQTHVGYVGEPQDGGARAIELFDQFKTAELNNVVVEVSDDTQVTEPETVLGTPEESGVGEGETSFEVPITRRERNS